MMNSNVAEQNVSRETSSNKVARKPKDAFCIVNEKYRNILSKQVQKENIDVKKMVFEEALKQVDSITKNNYLSALRDIVLNRLISNVKFCKDCIDLSLNPFAAAQNIAMSGKKQVEKVLSFGIESVYKTGNLNSLSDELFTEEEMAKARFTSLSTSPSGDQLNEASKLIDAVKQVLVIMNGNVSQRVQPA